MDNTVTLNADRLVKLMIGIDALAQLAHPEIATLSDELEQVRNETWFKVAEYLLANPAITKAMGEIL